MIQLTNRQARQFLLLKHGLLGEYKFTGKQGALDFVRQASCIQYDPIDVCAASNRRCWPFMESCIRCLAEHRGIESGTAQ